jgi:uncharacterized protein (TIGR02453 family)
MKDTLNFLTRLDKNNNRDWFQSHKNLYETSHNQMIHFADQLISEMAKHDHIEHMSGKKSLFRIYRDVRFGSDKTPYKTNWGGRIKRATSELRGGYYYQIGPFGSFVMGGFFGPNAADLLHIRKHLEQEGDRLREIVGSKSFKEFFGELLGSKLKTSPRGFNSHHPEIELLRYKQFMLRHDFDSNEVLHDNFPEIVSNAFKQMRPFFDFMSEILTTDLNGRSLV